MTVTATNHCGNKQVFASKWPKKYFQSEYPGQACSIVGVMCSLTHEYASSTNRYHQTHQRSNFLEAYCVLVCRIKQYMIPQSSETMMCVLVWDVLSTQSCSYVIKYKLTNRIIYIGHWKTSNSKLYQSITVCFILLVHTAIMVSVIRSMSLVIVCVAIISEWLGNVAWKNQSDGSISEFTASEYTMCVMIIYTQLDLSLIL